MRVTSTIDITDYFDEWHPEYIEASAVDRLINDANERLGKSGICAYHMLSGRLQDVQGEVTKVDQAKENPFLVIITVETLETPAGRLVGMFRDPMVAGRFATGTDDVGETITDIKLSRVGIVDGGAHDE